MQTTCYNGCFGYDIKEYNRSKALILYDAYYNDMWRHYSANMTSLYKERHSKQALSNFETRFIIAIKGLVSQLESWTRGTFNPSYKLLRYKQNNKQLIGFIYLHYISGSIRVNITLSNT